MVGSVPAWLIVRRQTVRAVGTLAINRYTNSHGRQRFTAGKRAVGGGLDRVSRPQARPGNSEQDAQSITQSVKLTGAVMPLRLAARHLRYTQPRPVRANVDFCLDLEPVRPKV